jgi:hypothetical protein
MLLRAGRANPSQSGTKTVAVMNRGVVQQIRPIALDPSPAGATSGLGTDQPADNSAASDWSNQKQMSRSKRLIQGLLWELRDHLFRRGSAQASKNPAGETSPAGLIGGSSQGSLARG